MDALRFRQMYICDENALANELDFKKALDLIGFADDADGGAARRLRVWAMAILRDAWTSFDTDNVLPSISSTVFFKLVELSLSMGKAPAGSFLMTRKKKENIF